MATGFLHVLVPYLLKMQCAYMRINLGHSIDIWIYAIYGNTNYRFEFIGRKEGLCCILPIYDNLKFCFKIRDDNLKIKCNLNIL